MRTKLLLAFGTLALLATTPADAQRCPWGGDSRCFTPLDFSQGFGTESVASTTPYVAAVRINPSVGTRDGGSVRLGPVAAVEYLNPTWDVSFGARASLRLLRFGPALLDHHGLFVSAEQLVALDGGRPASVALVANAGLLRVGGWVVHDWERDFTAIQFSLGTDLQVLLPLLFPGSRDDGEPDFGRAAATRPEVAR